MNAAFLTLGCKVNSYETEKMKQQFKQAGYGIVSFEEQAQVYIINTCTVTNIADRKSRKMIHRAKRNHPDALVVATGCYVDSSEKRGEKDPDVDLFVSNKEKENIFHIVDEAIKEALEKKKFEAGGCLAGMDALESGFSTEAKREEHTRAYINVQQGCNQYCTYCIIPYVRGPLFSRSEEDVIKEAEALAAKGFLEVVITGIHLSSYGLDRSEKKSFLELEGKPLLRLVERISKVDGIERIRLGSLEPRIITETFATELSGIRKICPHFHLSLQSGCDATLRRMNRHYSTEEYLEKAEILRRYFAEPAITTDIIVGFPGETEEEFMQTLRFAEKVQFSKIHMFKYSRRKGTMADAMDGQITENEKAERLKRLSVIEKKSEKDYQENFFQREEQVLFEEVISYEGENYLVGYTERYLRMGVKVMDVKKAEKRVNTIARVAVLDKRTKEFLLCELCDCE